jgi:hypothetical protein
VLETPLEELAGIFGIDPHHAFSIKLVQKVARKYLKTKLLTDILSV